MSKKPYVRTNPLALATNNNQPVHIDVLVVVDTDSIIAANPSPSKDPASPTAIDHSHQYMLCHDPRGVISGQATGDLNFKAHPRDSISFVGESISANSQDAVIVYGIQPFRGPNVLNPFTVEAFQRQGAVFPNTKTANGLPPVSTPASFISFDTTVASVGTEFYKVLFGLYTLDDDGENQVLYGYFVWDPTITVS